MTRVLKISRIVAALWGEKSGDGTAFFAALQLEPTTPFTPVTHTLPHGMPRLLLFDLSFADYCPDAADVHDFDEADEAFSQALDSSLAVVAAWLNSRPPTLAANCQAQGIPLKMKFEITIDSFLGHQSPYFELELPPAFLLACGQAGIPLVVFQEG